MVVGHCSAIAAEAKADPNAKENDGGTPLMNAVSFEHESCVRLLLPYTEVSKSRA